MAEERKIYKYCSMKTSIDILGSRAVMLNSPSNFNDPFDSSMGLEEHELTRMYNLYINYQLLKYMENLSKRQNLRLNGFQKIIVKNNARLIEQSRKICKKTNKYFAVPVLKKWTYLPKRIIREIKSTIGDSYDSFIDEFKPKLEKVRDEARISCFSTRNDSILMWSHYADSHKGVCFEFLESRGFIKEVEYTHIKPFFDLYEVSQRVLSSMFFEQDEVFLDDDLKNKLIKPFFTKSKEWSYENEARCVFSEDETYTSEFEHEDDKVFLKMNISRIFIGSKANKDDEVLIALISKAKENNIPVVYMKEDEKTFSVVPTKNNS